MSGIEELGITLSEEQKQNVEDFIRKVKREASASAVTEAKMEFRAGVAGSRRPDPFEPSSMNITTFFDTFEPYRMVTGLEGQQAINTFLTYLDSKSLNTIVSITGLTSNWDGFKTMVIKALSSPREAVQARFEIKRAKQGLDETVAQFGERLRDLGRLGYTVDEQVALESILKDALSGGVLRDEISILLIGKEGTFAECLEEAVK